MPTTVTRRTLDLAGLDVPVVELAGAHDGPLLTVIAGVHGCEYVPMAAVRRWTRDLAGREISGRIRAVPVLNRFLWLRCERAGFWDTTVAAGEKVSEGQVLGTVSSLDGSETYETITAPADGVIIFLTTSPAVADDGLLLGLGAR